MRIAKHLRTLRLQGVVSIPHALSKSKRQKLQEWHTKHKWTTEEERRVATSNPFIPFDHWTALQQCPVGRGDEIERLAQAYLRADELPAWCEVAWEWHYVRQSIQTTWHRDGQEERLLRKPGNLINCLFPLVSLKQFPTEVQSLNCSSSKNIFGSRDVGSALLFDGHCWHRSADPSLDRWTLMLRFYVRESLGDEVLNGLPSFDEYLKFYQSRTPCEKAEVKDWFLQAKKQLFPLETSL